MNDYFGDMVIDERFFGPNVDGPESIGHQPASLSDGRAPYADTCAGTTSVRTAEPGWHEPGEPMSTES